MLSYRHFGLAQPASTGTPDLWAGKEQ
jgi:hypothetical protein